MPKKKKHNKHKIKGDIVMLKKEKEQIPYQGHPRKVVKR